MRAKNHPEPHSHLGFGWLGGLAGLCMGFCPMHCRALLFEKSLEVVASDGAMSGALGKAAIHREKVERQVSSPCTFGYCFPHLTAVFASPDIFDFDSMSKRVGSLTSSPRQGYTSTNRLKVLRLGRYRFWRCRAAAKKAGYRMGARVVQGFRMSLDAAELELCAMVSCRTDLQDISASRSTSGAVAEPGFGIHQHGRCFGRFCWGGATRSEPQFQTARISAKRFFRRCSGLFWCLPSALHREPFDPTSRSSSSSDPGARGSFTRDSQGCFWPFLAH